MLESGPLPGTGRPNLPAHQPLDTYAYLEDMYAMQTSLSTNPSFLLHTECKLIHSSSTGTTPPDLGGNGSETSSDWTGCNKTVVADISSACTHVQVQAQAQPSTGPLCVGLDRKMTRQIKKRPSR